MLCPEVWNFSYTKNNLSATVGEFKSKKTEQFLEKLVLNHPFNETISIAISEENSVPDRIKTFLNSSFYYIIKDFKLEDFIRRDFIEAFIKRGNLTALSQIEFNEIDDIFAVTPNGILILTINKDLYQSLGLEGRLHKSSVRKKDRYDITSSKMIDNNSIKYLLELHHLKSLRLYRTSITIPGYIRILTKMPRLEDFGRFDAIGICLEHINLNTDNETLNLKLKSFKSHYATTDHIKLIAKLCPDVELVCLFHNQLINLMALIEINKLKDLRLLSGKFFEDHVRDVLELKGCNLTYLHLEHVEQIDINALMAISQYCPDLTTLIIYNCELVENHLKYFRKIIPTFMNLECLTIASSCTTKHLEFLLMNALKIKFIHIGTMVPTNDELFDNILMNNPLEYLEELHIICSTDLTVLTAYKLIETCKNLRILNELENWTKINKIELDYFREFIKIKNYNLDTKCNSWNSLIREENT